MLFVIIIIVFLVYIFILSCSGGPDAHVPQGDYYLYGDDTFIEDHETKASRKLGDIVSRFGCLTARGIREYGEYKKVLINLYPITLSVVMDGENYSVTTCTPEGEPIWSPINGVHVKDIDELRALVSYIKH